MNGGGGGKEAEGRRDVRSNVGGHEGGKKRMGSTE